MSVTGSKQLACRDVFRPLISVNIHSIDLVHVNICNLSEKKKRFGCLANVVIFFEKINWQLRAVTLVQHVKCYLIVQLPYALKHLSL